MQMPQSIGKLFGLVILATLSLGWFKSPRASVEPGLEFQKEGEYLKAYRYFEDLVQQFPRQTELQTYVDTARGLAFRQAAGQAQKALQRGDLEEFLQGMKLANDIQPSERAQSVVQLVESARLRGNSDPEILRELSQTMRAGERQDLKQALDSTAEIIGQEILDGRIGSPLAILEFTANNAPERAAAAAYFENALSEALLNNRIELVERKKMGEVMKEIALSGSGMADASRIVQVGQLSGALAVVAGNVFLAESGAKYQIRVIDVETSRVVWQETRDFIPGKDLTWMDP